MFCLTALYIVFKERKGLLNKNIVENDLETTNDCEFSISFQDLYFYKAYLQKTLLLRFKLKDANAVLGVELVTGNNLKFTLTTDKSGILVSYDHIISDFEGTKFFALNQGIGEDEVKNNQIFIPSNDPYSLEPNFFSLVVSNNSHEQCYNRTLKFTSNQLQLKSQIGFERDDSNIKESNGRNKVEVVKRSNEIILHKNEEILHIDGGINAFHVIPVQTCKIVKTSATDSIKIHIIPNLIFTKNIGIKPVSMFWTYYCSYHLIKNASIDFGSDKFYRIHTKFDTINKIIECQYGGKESIKIDKANGFINFHADKNYRSQETIIEFDLGDIKLSNIYGIILY